MALTYAGANQFLKILSGKEQGVVYPSVYIGLGTSSGTPARDGTGFVEPSGANYKRVLLGNSTGVLQKMGTPTNGSVTNNNSAHELNGRIIFPALGASESWGTITHVGLYSAATGGTLIAYAQLDTSFTPAANSTPEIPASGMTFTLT